MKVKIKHPDPGKAKKYFSSKLAFTMGPADLKYFLDEGESPNIIDVRAEEDFADAHIPGAVNIPQERWRAAEGLSKNKVNIIYCYNALCHLAARAAFYFSAKGYPVMELEGGMDGWKGHGYETERGAHPGAATAPKLKAA